MTSNKAKQINKHLPLVVIFGRTNVGKSTLFNCLVEKNQALVSEIEGTTRDSNIGKVQWQGRDFELVDTGGIIDIGQLLETAKASKVDEIQTKIERQARGYLKQADLILFTVDNKTGLLPQDRQMALLLKKILGEKIDNILLVVNKVDNFKQAGKSADFYRLALGEPITISATTGAGTGDLLDLIINRLPKPKNLSSVELAKEEIKVIMIGKPNVGKSSLLNSILGEDRVIVSPIPHTTREPQHTELLYNEQPIKLIDTAGITKKGQQASYRKNSLDLEKYGIAKSLSSLDNADLALLILDINEEITHQDAKIVEEIVERQKSIIIVANKWDLIKEKDTKKFTNYIYGELPFINWAPIIFVSALTGSKVKKILDLILAVAEQRKKEIAPSILNSFLMKIVKIHKPAKGKGLKHPHIHKFEQIQINPPVFEIRIGSKDNLHFSYLNFVTNRLREKFGYLGTPIKIWVTKNRKVHGKAEMSEQSKQGKKPVRHARRILRYH